MSVAVNLAAAMFAIQFLSWCGVAWWQSGRIAQNRRMDVYQSNFEWHNGVMSHTLLVVFLVSDAVSGQYVELGGLSDAQLSATILASIVIWVVLISVALAIRVVLSDA